MNAADPHHSTLNSYIDAFRTVWLHLRPFCYDTILYAKWVEILQLMQKYVPRSRVGIFRNDRSQPTAIDPNLMFWCVLYHLGAFGTVSLLYETWCKKGRTGAINAKVRATKVGVERAELVQLMQTFVPWSRIVIFPNERSRSSAIYSKLIYWCILYRLAAFETILLWHDSICKTSRNLAMNAKVHAKKSRRNFLQLQLPTHSNIP